MSYKSNLIPLISQYLRHLSISESVDENKLLQLQGIKEKLCFITESNSLKLIPILSEIEGLFPVVDKDNKNELFRFSSERYERNIMEEVNYFRRIVSLIRQHKAEITNQASLFVRNRDTFHFNKISKTIQGMIQVTSSQAQDTRKLDLLELDTRTRELLSNISENLSIEGLLNDLFETFLKEESDSRSFHETLPEILNAIAGRIFFDSSDSNERNVSFSLSENIIQKIKDRINAARDVINEYHAINSRHKIPRGAGVRKFIELSTSKINLYQKELSVIEHSLKSISSTLKKTNRDYQSLITSINGTYIKNKAMAS